MGNSLSRNVPGAKRAISLPSGDMSLIVTGSRSNAKLNWFE